MRLLTTVSALVVLGIAACGGDRRTAPVAAQPLNVMTAPWYAVACQEAYGASLNAQALASSGEVALLDKATGARALIATVRSPQGVAVGTQQGTGRAFVVVVETDYDANDAAVLAYTDDNADGLPDASTRAVIVERESSHLVYAAYDAASGALYVIDGLQDVILRFEDTTGDGVPDGSATTFVATGGILGTPLHARQVRAALEESVEIVQRRYLSDGSPRPRDRVVRAEDGTGDGVADGYVEVPETVDDRVAILGYVVAGEGTVEVRARMGVDYRVNGVSSAGTETLATFQGTGKGEEVALSRAVVDGEHLEIVEIGSGARVAVAATVGTGDVVFDHVQDALETKVRGGSVVFAGHGVTGLEVVEARVVDSEDEWVPCTVSSSTTESLTVVIPMALNVENVATVMFRITVSEDLAYTFRMLCRE